MRHKKKFIADMRKFANSLNDYVSENGGDWSMKGLIDDKKNIFTLSSDTKIISKILEIQLFPKLTEFANKTGYEVIPAEKQNWYPDMSFVSKSDESIKFAVDIKTTYRKPQNEDMCNGFTLGSHGGYFHDREKSKNIQFPYGSYCGHIILGVIYSRKELDDNAKVLKLNELDSITSVIGDIVFFVEEKWKIASDKSGSGNTANIGSIKNIKDILAGNGVFAKAGEKFFDEYWLNYGQLEIIDTKTRKPRKISTFKDFLEFKNESEDLLNPSSDSKQPQGNS